MFEKQRKLMVEAQIKARGVKDKKVLKDFLKVPRHEFVPKELQDEAYNDCPLPIGNGQTISQPYIVALMTEALNLNKKDKVLEVGTGSGYQTAILAELAKKVYTIELYKELSERAENILKKSNYKNIHFIVGDGKKGFEKESPYDKIIITAAAKTLPESLLKQLKVEGIMVLPLGGGFVQHLLKITKLSKDKYKKEKLEDVLFVPLV